MKLRRVLIILGIILGVPVLLVGALVLVVQSQWGETWLEARVSKALDREVQIDGISVLWGWPPGLVFGRLRVSNPPWATTPSLVDAQGLYARFAIPPLFTGRVVVPYFGARKATAGLEVDGEHATWRFGKDSQQESRMQLGILYLDDGHIVYKDANEKSDLAIDVKGSLGEHGELRATGTGVFRGEPTKASVRIPGLSAQHRSPIQVEGKATVGKTEGSAEGSFATDAKTLDLKLRLKGQSMKDLHKVTGIVLPDTPPYNIAGRLRHEGTQWIFDPFDGKVGDSDLAGAVTYVKGGKRPLFRANLTSKLLDLDDLGPIIGAPPKTGPGETAAPRQVARAAERAASNRLLPDEKFGVDAWAKMDADVRLEAKRVMRPKQLPIDTLSTHLVLQDSVLKLAPLEFGIADGRITSNITLNAQARPVRGDMKADVQGIHLAKLFPTLKSMQDALGTLYGHADLAGTGQSVAELLGTSSGKASVAVDKGRVSQLLVELIELDMADVIMLLGRKHDQVELRCAVSGFDVKDGVAKADSFVVDTSDSVIKVEGAIDLKNERLDLETHAHPKDVSILSLRTPITMKGPLRKPSVRPKAGPIAARVAAVGVLASINPALAVLATLETGKGKDTDCAKILAEAKAHGAVKKKS
jgi:uncharacterized protein involved in outer membrane biogenesis